MVAGKLEAKGRSSADIKLTLYEERPEIVESSNNETETTPSIGLDIASTQPIRLYGGRNSYEGRLQVCLLIIS